MANKEHANAVITNSLDEWRLANPGEQLDLAPDQALN